MQASADQMLTRSERDARDMPDEWIARLMAEVEADKVKAACVYFVGWEGGPIKIGFAANVPHRLHQIQVHCPYQIKVLARVTGTLELEAKYHRRFANYRMRGEWFERCPDILAEIARLSPLSPLGGM